MHVLVLLGILSFAAPVFIPGSTADAQPSTTRRMNAQVTLLSDSSVVAAGSTAQLGFRFRMEPGWHIYWRNPGGAGSPPAPRWQTPSSITVGDIQWPVPERIVSGPVVSYGYEDEILLTMPVTVAADATGDQAISARVNYVICSKVCIQEFATASLTLPVGPAAKPSGAAPDFAAAATRIPKPMPADWRTTASIGSDTVTLNVQTGASVSGGIFFPYDGSLIDETAPQDAMPQPQGVSLTLRKSPYFVAAPETIEGVLVLPDQPGILVSARVSN